MRCSAPAISRTGLAAPLHSAEPSASNESENIHLNAWMTHERGADSTDHEFMMAKNIKSVDFSSCLYLDSTLQFAISDNEIDETASCSCRTPDRNLTSL